MKTSVTKKSRMEDVDPQPLEQEKIFKIEIDIAMEPDYSCIHQHGRLINGDVKTEPNAVDTGDDKNAGMQLPQSPSPPPNSSYQSYHSDAKYAYTASMPGPSTYLYAQHPQTAEFSGLMNGGVKTEPNAVDTGEDHKNAGMKRLRSPSPSPKSSYQSYHSDSKYACTAAKPGPSSQLFAQHPQTAEFSGLINGDVKTEPNAVDAGEDHKNFQISEVSDVGTSINFTQLMQQQHQLPMNMSTGILQNSLGQQAVIPKSAALPAGISLTAQDLQNVQNQLLLQGQAQVQQAQQNQLQQQQQIVQGVDQKQFQTTLTTQSQVQAEQQARKQTSTISQPQTIQIAIPSAPITSSMVGSHSQPQHATLQTVQIPASALQAQGIQGLQGLQGLQQIVLVNSAQLGSLQNLQPQILVQNQHTQGGIPVLQGVTTVMSQPSQGAVQQQQQQQIQQQQQQQQSQTLTLQTNLPVSRPRLPELNSPTSLDSQIVLPTVKGSIHLEEVEQFAKTFKRRRIELGFTQEDVGIAIGKLFGKNWKQTMISRFESLNLSLKNMCKLKPLLQKWLQDADIMSSTIGLNAGGSLGAGLNSNALGQRKIKRTRINKSIQVALEKSFITNSKPSSDEISSLANSLKMKKKVVWMWFCNRRQKEKRINSPAPFSTPHMQEGNMDWKEVELFAKTFKCRRIELGFTQEGVGLGIGKLYGKKFKQSTISRFESLELSLKNMCKLKPLLQNWLQDADTMSRTVKLNAGGSLGSGLNSDALGQRKKNRTMIINTSIHMSLEKSFMTNSKPSSDEISSLANSLNMKKEVVRVWFCNRRQKEKRKRLNPPTPFSTSHMQVMAPQTILSPVSIASSTPATPTSTVTTIAPGTIIINLMYAASSSVNSTGGSAH